MHPISVPGLSPLWRRTASGPARIRRAGIPLLFAVLCLIGSGLRPALAGPNEGGKLILHAEPTLSASGQAQLCGWSDLSDPKEALTEVPATGNEKLVVFFVMAAFPDFAMPDVQGVMFGIEYNDSRMHPVAWKSCGDFIVPQQNWPDSDTGIQITFPQNDPMDRRLGEICWFATYAYSGAVFKLIPHPAEPPFAEGGYFGDTSTPSTLDEIEGYGSMGFGTHGFNPCAEEQAFGACCDENGQCVQQTRIVCEGQGMGYTFAGENVDCGPNICTPGMGACCLHGECRAMAWDACLNAGGIFIGQGSGCTPTPCTFSEYTTSWGGLKHIYSGH